MAGVIHSTTTKHQKLITEKNQEDPNKFYYHFCYKATLVAVFFVILPLFPSQAPEFINQSLVTRNWELLHILFVGIAISYGLFSRRQDETEKENGAKFDNAQSLVSRFLQVSSFFEDEAETPSELSDEGTKVQTWSNQHYRNEPVVVVAPQAQKHSSFDNKGGAGGSSRIGEKPLLLPVRSLKSRLCDDPNDDVVDQPVNEPNTTSSLSLNRSSSKISSKRFSPSNSMKARNAELEGPGSPRVVEKVKDNVVLPSPVPWRSRSGRLEPKQEDETPTQYASSKPSMEESEFIKMEPRSVRSQTSRSSRTSTMSPSPKLTPSPKELSPSPSFSSESLAKNAEDVVRKKVFYKSCPPPPPPPPPMFQKSISMKPIRYGLFNEGGSFDKELKRSFTGERNMSMGGKWGRSFSAEKNMASFSRGKEVGAGGMNGIMEGNQLEDEEKHFIEGSTRKANISKGYDYENMSFRSDKFMGHASVPLLSEPASMEFGEEEEKESFLDKVILETDDEDSETEDEDVVGRIMQKDSVEIPPVVGEGTKTGIGPCSGSIGDEGPDVDKKADEFIAKFREQIRLQRIESIKRSTRSTRNSSR